MVQISHHPLKEHIWEKLFHLFFEVIGKKSDKEEFKKIVFDLLSHTERVMIAKRIAIIYLLLKNIDQKTICKVLRVSSSTVSKFSLLFHTSQGIKPFLMRIIKNEKMYMFVLEFFEALFPPGTPGTNWKAGWERRKELSRLKNEGL